jgi:endonuclease/exonuclease/phosphatase family metal-dependent hydrolase
MRRIASAAAVVFLLLSTSQAQEHIVVASWNIEKLGGSGRGFGSGHGAGLLGSRTAEDLKKVAHLIRDELKLDVVAAQEIAVTDIEGDHGTNNELDAILEELGPDWKYFLAPPPGGETPDPEDEHNIHCALLWNSARVRLAKSVVMDIPNLNVGTKRAFDRRPLIGYFEVRNGDSTTNDFLLINVHLASGQENDENHLAAMVIIEQNLSHFLKRSSIRESDRIVLGDFNDNPYARDADGDPRFTNFLYQYMAHKKYRDLVTETSPATRMNIGLTSIIDHVLINDSADVHIPNDAAEVYRPADATPAGLAAWRRTFSDHFPVMFKIRIESEDDDVD